MKVVALLLLLLGTASSFSISWRDISTLFNSIWSNDRSINQAFTPNLLELAEGMKLTKCVEKLKEVGISRVINHEGWFTVFCPTNEAFAHEKFFPGQDTLTEKMRMHVARGKFNSSSFQNEVVFRSLLSQRLVRINVYSTQKSTMVTANGQPIVSMNHHARNGILHVISGVMSSVYDRGGSVVSEIEDCCPQHTNVVDLIRHAGLYNKMDKAEHITFLAPTNGAFTRLHPEFMTHIKQNPRLLREVLNSHVINGTWYTAGLTSGDKLKTWAGNFVTVTRNHDDVKFENAETGWANINAKNGVAHVVESLIIPKTAQKEIKKLLNQLHYQ